MADNSVVHIGENSPEQVAYKLLRLVAGIESKEVPTMNSGNTHADRKWLLDTFAECLEAAKGYRARK